MNLSRVVALLVLFLFKPLVTFADLSGEGVGAGGGGDAATEMKMADIRADLYDWIKKGGAKNLKMPPNVTYEQYEKAMLHYLTPDRNLRYHAVVFGSVTTEEEKEAQKAKNEERIVSIGGEAKTCRGFYSKRDNLPHILCNVERFAAATPAERYKQQHHEFCGLAGLEENIGPSSDYFFSLQITAFVQQELVWKLSVKPAPTPTPRAKLPTCTVWTAQNGYTVYVNGMSSGSGFSAKQAIVERDTLVQNNICIAPDMKSVICEIKAARSGYTISMNGVTAGSGYGAIQAIQERDLLIEAGACSAPKTTGAVCEIQATGSGYTISMNGMTSGSGYSAIQVIQEREHLVRAGVCIK